MFNLSHARILQLYAIGALSLLTVQYAFAFDYKVMLFTVILLFSGIFGILGLFLSISVGKYLLSWLIVLLRYLLVLPFRLIRAIPYPVRVVLLEAPIVVIFYLWYRALVFLDRHVTRRLISARHPSGAIVSTANSFAPTFRPLAQFSKKVSADFDLQAALSLCNVSKIAYEDEKLIKFELDAAGYDMSTFKTISYHNTSGFMVMRKDVLIIAFRGTEPTNLMNIATDVKGRLVYISNLDETPVEAGRVHYGFLEALRLHRIDTPNAKASESNSDEEDTKQDQKKRTRFPITSKLASLLLRIMELYAAKPIHRQLLRPQGRRTAFQQIQDALEEYDRSGRLNHIYVTGHSLGGALGTVFFAQAQLSAIPKSLTDKMQVYSFGAPRVGDAKFKEWMDGSGASERMFKVVHAQDLVPRQPALPRQVPKRLHRYADAPGTLIHLHPLVKRRHQLEEIPGLTQDPAGAVPSIAFWSLTGLLSLETISLIRSESWLWIGARIVMPFFIFDHLPSEYSRVMSAIWSRSDEGHFHRQLHSATSDPTIGCGAD